jgi:Zn-ribbon RNA-binding protein
MVKKESICTSCKRKVMNFNGSIKFNCPNCGKEEIIRCKDCRANVIKYVCSSCKFEGPN